MSNLIALAVAVGISALPLWPAIVSVAAGILWAISIVVAARILFKPCGASGKYHWDIEDVKGAELPARQIGSLIGDRSGTTAVVLVTPFVILTVAVCLWT